MLRDKDIICISSIDWDFVWQGHQEIMSAFAKNNNRVLFIENTGIRTPRFSDMGRLRHRIVNWRKGLRGIREESKNLFICSPLILPLPYSKIARFINRHLLINSIKIWMKAIGFKKPIIWTFLPTSISIDIIDRIDNSLVVYYCIAEFTELASSSKKVERAEIELLKRCDIIFAQGAKIKERCQRHNKNVSIFPFGVKSDVFLRPAGSLSRPGDTASIKKPIYGYIGGIHKHIDFKLLRTLAESDPQASVVLVGPVQTNKMEGLDKMNNVYFLGKKPHDELPAYIDTFDVCLIPYLITEYTKTVYPTKLNEYLMRGKRVLSTMLPEVAKFVKESGEVVFISETTEDFVKKAHNILKMPEDRAFARRAMELAGRNSWEKRIEDMSTEIESAISDREKTASGRWRDNFSRVIRLTKKRFLAVASLAFITYLLLFHTPFVWWIASPLKVTTPLAKADVIVVLGGGVGESGRPGQGYEERVKYASELYKNNYAGKMIFSSGFVYALQEADVMKALAISLGVSPKDIILEKKAHNTYENARFSLDIADREGYKRVIFVSSPYHMLRLKMAAEKISRSRHYLIYSAIPHSLFYGDDGRVTLQKIKAIIHEYLGITYYRLKGYV